MPVTPSVQYAWDGPGGLGAGDDGKALTWDQASGKFVMSTAGGVTDHGALTGLGDDDHTQYLLVDGTRAMTGQLQVPNGTSAAPGLTFADTDTGIFSGGGGDLRLGANGTGRLQVNSAGVRVIAGNLSTSPGRNISVEGGNIAIVEDNAAEVPLTVNLAAAQSADAFEVKDNAAVVLASVGASGIIRANPSPDATAGGYQFREGVDSGQVAIVNPGLYQLQVRCKNLPVVECKADGGSVRYLGFFGTSPAAQQTGRNAIGQWMQALADLGLFQTTQPNNQALAQTFSTAVVPMVVKGASGQTANLQEWQNSSGSILAKVNASGRMTVDGGSTSAGSFGLTVGRNTGVGISAVWDGSQDAGYLLVKNARVAMRFEESGSAAALGFFGAAPVARPDVSGSRGGNAALASLLTALANLGLITDSTT